MFDTERFIAEIERRPAIYDVNSDDYTNHNSKLIAWEQICEIMIPKWKSLSQQQRHTEEKILRGKWRNIRDYFMKELQKIRKGGAPGKKRKKYTYFDQLLFLMPSVDSRKKKSVATFGDHYKNEEAVDLNEEEDPLMNKYEMPLTHQETDDYTNEESNQHTFRYMAAEQYPKSICETSLALPTEEFPDIQSTSSQKIKHDEDDFDRMFLLSLLPTMRRIPEVQKLDVRIQMQQILAKAIHGLSNNN